MSKEFHFRSRRAPLITCHGAVSCDIPLASQIGLDVLRDGGNAADAAVAMTAAMGLTMPPSTGLGGDAFCLFYDAKTKTVKGLNGSGRTPSRLSLQKIFADGYGPDRPVPTNHAHSVTVPGAVAAMVDTVEHFGSGKLSLERLLRPTIDLAETGFPVTDVSSNGWTSRSHLLMTDSNLHGHALLIDGHAPRCGEVFRNPDLARSLKEVASNGKDGFYKGRIARAITDAVARHGGVMTMDDLAAHVTTLVEPISVEYKGLRLWEIPPNGQGIVALMALNIVEQFDLKSMGLNSVPYIHTISEALRLAFSDGRAYVADPDSINVPVAQMLSKDRAKKRAAMITPDKPCPDISADVMSGSDTEYHTTVDIHGNACSFISSNYQGLGTGIVPEGCGFPLQNRGQSFSYVEGHPNAWAPNKRPYHTIIPAMVTSDKTGDLLASYGVMGGNMQPQGHLQVLLNMAEFGLDPQAALDVPRIYVEKPLEINLEDGFSDDIINGLAALGYDVKKTSGYDRSLHGRGHVITNGAWWSRGGRCYDDKNNRVWWTGSDPRSDAVPAGY